MKRTKLIPFVALLAGILFYFPVHGQQGERPSTPRPITLHYNAACELTTPEKAFFYRETLIDLENFVFSGIAKDYLSSNHNLISEGYFDHGVNRGLHSDYFESGKLQSTIEYADEGFIIWEFVDAQNNVKVTKGTGKFAIDCYSINAVENSGVTLSGGTIIGEFRNGKRSGTWVYQNKAGVTTDEENYDKQPFSRVIFHSDGQTSVTNEKKQIIISLTGLLTESFGWDTTGFPTLNDYVVKQFPPYNAGFKRWITYPGGMKKILLIMARQLRTGIDENIIIKISVDDNGKFEKVKTGLLYGTDFNEEVKGILKVHETRFLPAIKNGQPYSFTMKIPLGNSQQWMNYLQTATDEDVNAYLDELNTEN